MFSVIDGNGDVCLQEVVGIIFVSLLTVNQLDEAVPSSGM